MEKFKTIGFTLSGALLGALDLCATKSGMGRSEWLRLAIVDACKKQGVPVDNIVSSKEQGRGRRTDLTDPERRKKAEKQLAAARAARKTFRGKLTPEASAELRAKRLAERRDAVGRARLLVQGVPEETVDAFYATRRNAEAYLGRALTRTEWARLKKEVSEFLRKGATPPSTLEEIGSMVRPPLPEADSGADSSAAAA